MANIDIDKYKRRAYRKKKVLSRFLQKVGRSKKPGILKVVAEVNEEVWKDVACLNCANCCKKMTPTYTRKDINRISKHFGMSYQQFFDKWLYVDENKDIVNVSKPCQFLGKDNKCSIYAIRPGDCSGFPHVIRNDFRYQAKEKTYVNNLALCPATLVFVEKLKERIEADL
jgi:Fe-S-cluster containining protein